MPGLSLACFDFYPLLLSHCDIRALCEKFDDNDDWKFDCTMIA